MFALPFVAAWVSLAVCEPSVQWPKYGTHKSSIVISEHNPQSLTVLFAVGSRGTADSWGGPYLCQSLPHCRGHLAKAENDRIAIWYFNSSEVDGSALAQRFQFSDQSQISELSFEQTPLLFALRSRRYFWSKPSQIAGFYCCCSVSFLCCLLCCKIIRESRTEGIFLDNLRVTLVLNRRSVIYLILHCSVLVASLLILDLRFFQSRLHSRVWPTHRVRKKWPPTTLWVNQDATGTDSFVRLQLSFALYSVFCYNWFRIAFKLSGHGTSMIASIVKSWLILINAVFLVALASALLVKRVLPSQYLSLVGTIVFWVKSVSTLTCLALGLLFTAHMWRLHRLAKEHVTRMKVQLSPSVLRRLRGSAVYSTLYLGFICLKTWAMVTYPSLYYSHVLTLILVTSLADLCLINATCSLYHSLDYSRPVMAALQYCRMTDQDQDQSLAKQETIVLSQEIQQLSSEDPSRAGYSHRMSVRKKSLTMSASLKTSSTVANTDRPRHRKSTFIGMAPPIHTNPL